ncbi:hypothetical protein B0H21DRAFT_856855 [Amylocystis lapponica]|nr:hypothetical protein B0H21DRAFT_856855 [Amylocystis lapponica]
MPLDDYTNIDHSYGYQPSVPLSGNNLERVLPLLPNPDPEASSTGTLAAASPVEPYDFASFNSLLPPPELSVNPITTSAPFIPPAQPEVLSQTAPSNAFIRSASTPPSRANSPTLSSVANAGGTRSPAFTPDFGDNLKDADTKHRGRGTGTRARFTKIEMYKLIQWANAVDPWNAPFGQKGNRWGEVLKRARAEGYCKQISGQEAAKNKVNHMISYHESGDHASGVTSDVKMILDSEEGASFSALLDTASELRDGAMEQSEKQQESKKRKADQDHIGGEAIRTNAMRARKLCRDRSPARDENENELPRHQSKRRRTNAESNNDSVAVDLHNMFEEKRQQDREFQADVVKELRIIGEKIVDGQEKMMQFLRETQTVKQ